LARVIQAVLDKHEATYNRIWEESRKLVRYLRQAEAPIPEVLRITARHVLEEEILAELERAAEAGVIPEAAFEAADEARSLGLTLDLAAGKPAMAQAIGRALDALAEPTPERVSAAVNLARGANRLGVPFGLWHTQNGFFVLWREHPHDHAVLRPLAQALGFDLEETPA
jgi:hypothetical protein